MIIKAHDEIIIVILIPTINTMSRITIISIKGFVDTTITLDKPTII